MSDQLPSYFGKVTATLMPADLRAYEPLAYEIEMLVAIARLVVSWEAGWPAQFTESLVAEAFALHVRNVSEFFWPKSDRTTDVHAKHFASDPTRWVGPSEPSGQGDIVNRVNVEAAHLTTHRLPGRLPRKEWQVLPILRQLDRKSTRLNSSHRL